MTRKQNDYTNTCFYRIVSKDLNIKDTYVGHTIDFKRRAVNHCHNTNNYKKQKVYNFIRQNGGWGNFDMILIEQIACRDSLDARIKERAYIEQFNSTLNVKAPFRSSTESFEIKKEHAKQYYENHKEHVLHMRKLYYENNKEHAKQYYENNRDKIAQQRHTRCICDNCGREYQKCTKSRHLQSNYCITHPTLVL